MNAQSVARRKCLGKDCEQECVGALQCPVCIKAGIDDSFFCSQLCFERSWKSHKIAHGQTKQFDPFPQFHYTGSLRPLYPLSQKRTVPDTIPYPEYWSDGNPRGERQAWKKPNDVAILDEKAQSGMRRACRLAREVLDMTAAAAKPGVTTDELDRIAHKACLERSAYPSPLNYYRFPKSICTSLNEVICHGIPDQRELRDGDILNIDVSIYHKGYHADVNETYYIGDKARADPDSVRVVETARECLVRAIATVKPGSLIRDIGKTIQPYAESQGCSVVRAFVGHGIHTLFHPPPNIPHYARNKAVGELKEGMCFTIEPMINLGTHLESVWPDTWTCVTRDGRRSAQFEHTLLVTSTGVEVLTARVIDEAVV